MWNIYARLQVHKCKNTVIFIATAAQTPNLAFRICIVGMLAKKWIKI